MPTGAPTPIAIPEQGFDLGSIEREAVVEFFDKEIAFYNRIAPVTAGSFVHEGRSYGELNLSQNAVQNLESIKKSCARNEFDKLESYVADARKLKLVVGQGKIGQIVDELTNDGRQAEAKWVMYINCVGWLRDRPGLDDAIGAYRAALIGNPATYAFADALSVSQARRDATRAQKSAKESEKALDVFIRDKSNLLDDLEQKYRTKLTLEEPAISWQNIAKAKTGAWRRWLSLFSLLIVIPLFLVVFFWGPVSQAVVQITTPGGGISLAGVAAVTVPALLYAWLLKNVSRVFIQNLNLADDASHRRALALTYLGLVENPKMNVTDQDRALILNALFRPIPPHQADEGPPSGLLELIKKQ